MLNYFYPALTILPTSLSNNQYTSYNNTLYYKHNDIISIAKQDHYLYYDLTEGHNNLYEVKCGASTPVCCANILFDIVNKNWVLFKATTCPKTKCCITTIDSIQCECYVNEEIIGTIDDPNAQIFGPSDFNNITYINQVPYLDDTDSNIIRNVGSTTGTSTYGINTDITNYIKFDILPDGESIPVKASTLYRFGIDAVLKMDFGTIRRFNEYVYPTYELSVEFDSSGIIVPSNRLMKNNQCVYLSNTFLAGSLDSAPQPNPTYPIIIILINQPEPYMIKLAYLILDAQSSPPYRIQGSVKVNIVSKAISFTF